MSVSKFCALAIAFACLACNPVRSIRLMKQKQRLSKKLRSFDLRASNASRPSNTTCSLEDCKDSLAWMKCDMDQCNRLLHPDLIEAVRNAFNATLAQGTGSCDNKRMCFAAEPDLLCSRYQCAGFFGPCTSKQCQRFWKGESPPWCATRMCAFQQRPAETPAQRGTCASLVKGATEYSSSIHRGDCKCPSPKKLFPIDCRQEPYGWGHEKHFYKASYKTSYTGIRGFLETFSKESRQRVLTDPDFFLCHCSNDEATFDGEVWHDLNLLGSEAQWQREKYARAKQYVDFALEGLNGSYSLNHYNWKWKAHGSSGTLKERILAFQEGLKTSKQYGYEARKSKQQEFDQQDEIGAKQAEIGCEPVDVRGRRVGNARAESIFGCLRRNKPHLVPRQLKAEDPRVPFMLRLTWSRDSNCLRADADGTDMATQALVAGLSQIPDTETPVVLPTSSSEPIKVRITSQMTSPSGNDWNANQHATVQFIGPYDVRIHMYFPVKRSVTKLNIITQDMIWIELSINEREGAKAALYYHQEGDDTFSKGYAMQVE